MYPRQVYFHRQKERLFFDLYYLEQNRQFKEASLIRPLLDDQINVLS